MTCSDIVLKCDVTNILILEIMGFLKMLEKTLMKNAYFLKIISLLQFRGEILVPSCFDDSIQETITDILKF